MSERRRRGRGKKNKEGGKEKETDPEEGTFHFSSFYCIIEASNNIACDKADVLRNSLYCFQNLSCFVKYFLHTEKQYLFFSSFMKNEYKNVFWNIHVLITENSCRLFLYDESYWYNSPFEWQNQR